MAKQPYSLSILLGCIDAPNGQYHTVLLEELQEVLKVFRLLLQSEELRRRERPPLTGPQPAQMNLSLPHPPEALYL